jgi:hypothetical protein
MQIRATILIGINAFLDAGKNQAAALALNLPAPRRHSH